MPGKIFIESNPFLNTGYYHAYLVYQDSNGQEFVIRGGPQKDWLHPLGSIQTEAGIPMDRSDDARNISQAYEFGRKEIDLGGRNAADIWGQMQTSAENIQSLQHPYNPIGTEDSIGWGIFWGNNDQAHNSNSTVAAILQSVGIDPLANIPTNTNAERLPGIYRPLSIPSSDNDASYTPPLGIPDSNADNPTPMNFAPSASTAAPSATQLTNRILESLGGQAGQGIPRSASGGFALPSASNLARSLISSNRRTLENSLLELFTGGRSRSEIFGQQQSSGLFPDFGDGIGASFNSLFMNMLDNMIGQIFNQQRTRTTVSETERSRQASAAWGTSSSQYAAQLAGWMQQGGRNL